MSKLLSVDPGIRGCGVALFENGLLARAAYVKNFIDGGNDASYCYYMAREIILYTGEEDCFFKQGEILTLAVESPQVYTSSKGDPNDLLPLFGVNAALYTMLRTAMGSSLAFNQYLPRQWKGQMTKEVCHARIKDRLSPAESAAIEPTPKSLIHNVFDAVGIGLYALNRFNPKRFLND